MMERIYLLWWALVVGAGLTGLLLAAFDAIQYRQLTRKNVSAGTSVALVLAAVWVCPSMLQFDYDGLNCTEARYGVSWLLLAAAASTLLLAFRSNPARRAQAYLRHKQGE